VGIYRRRKLPVETLLVDDPEEIRGINSRTELAEVGTLVRQKKNEELMAAGVTLVDPATTYIDPRAEIGGDTVIHPGVVIEGPTRIGRACEIQAHVRIADAEIGDHVNINSFCVIVESRIASGAAIGPFAHLRPASAVGRGREDRQLRRAEEDVARRGLEGQSPGVPRRRHVGDHVNVGAGTITCNYDGEKKHQTIIGDGAFIGSDSQLVAPVTVGKGAYVAAGSSITQDVPDGALGIARARQNNIEGWVERKKAVTQKGVERSFVCAGSSDTSDRSLSCPCSSTGCGAWISRLRLGGVALVSPEGIELRRSAGKLINLENAIRTEPLDGVYGVGHTRWATHGRPTEENAHPHRDCTGKIVVVHNGIIENYLELKHELQGQGHVFKTETDTEIVAHLVEREMKTDGLENAVRRALKVMRGMFALVLVSVDDPEKIVAVRNGPPIVVGLGDNEFFVASDIPPSCRTRATSSSWATRRWPSSRGRASSSPTTTGARCRRPRSACCGIRSRRRRAATSTSCSRRSTSSRPPRATPSWAACRSIAARSSSRTCTSRREAEEPAQGHHPGVRHLVARRPGGKYMLEALAQVPVEVEYGSEYRYRNPIVAPNELAIVITQSGETADTRAALHEAAARARAASPSATSWERGDARRRRHGLHARGPEIGVASTKAFTSQLVALQLLGLYSRRSAAR
jgi:acetyltransferase-like isoleucine patch superfamily enzyme